MEPMTYNGDERVVAIEYQIEQGRIVPLAVFTTSLAQPSHYCQLYDFDWCKRDQQIYYHNSGSGCGPYIHPLSNPKARVPLWFDPEFTPVNGGNISKRKLSLRSIDRFGYQIIAAPITLLVSGSANPFDGAINDSTEFCPRCRDHLPTESLCQHIWWCEKCGNYSAPQERCKHKRPSE